MEEEKQMMVCSSQTRWHCERLWEALGKTSAASSAGITVTLLTGEAAWSVGSTLQSQASLLCREVTGERAGPAGTAYPHLLGHQQNKLLLQTTAELVCASV